jgi:hypothetical protein
MVLKGTDVTARRGTGWVGVACVLLLLAADASAQGLNRPLRARNAEGGDRQRMLPAQRPEHASPGDDAAQRGGRLSPDDRRQLRRDVHEAGRDLYPNRMRSGRREQRR